MMNTHWVTVRCEVSGVSEAMPAVAEASEATSTYNAYNYTIGSSKMGVGAYTEMGTHSGGYGTLFTS